MPPWLRDQILANIHALYPDKRPSTLNIMTGRSELAPKYSIVGPDGTLVTQYMCYANVYCVVSGEAGRKLEIVVYGKAVLGGTEEAMVGLAGVVEDRVDEVYGVGGVKGRGRLVGEVV